MSLPVWPSAFIRFAVAMCSLSSTLRGRPNMVPLARDAARLRAVRSLVSSRSYSASEPRTPIIILPAAVEESMPSVTDTNVTRRAPLHTQSTVNSRRVVQVPIQRSPTNTKVFGDVPNAVAIRLHSLRGRDVLRVLNLAGASEPGAVGTRCGSLEGSALLGQLPLVFSK